jgi:hypothetical protein
MTENFAHDPRIKNFWTEQREKVDNMSNVSNFSIFELISRMFTGRISSIDKDADPSVGAYQKNHENRRRG